MFDMFDLFISLHPHILMSLGSCALACILASLYPYVRVYLLASLRPCILASLHPYVCVYMLVSSHSYILISLGSCALTYIPASSYPQVPMCLLLSSCPRILISLGWCTLGAGWYSRILTSRYFYVRVLWVLVGILTHSHPHILRFQGSYLFGKLKSDKTNVSNIKTAFMETNNGSNKFLTK